MHGGCHRAFEGPDKEGAVAVFVFASAREIRAAGHQIQGAIGFTSEHVRSFEPATGAEEWELPVDLLGRTYYLFAKPVVTELIPQSQRYCAY